MNYLLIQRNSGNLSKAGLEQTVENLCRCYQPVFAGEPALTTTAKFLTEKLSKMTVGQYAYYFGHTIVCVTDGVALSELKS